MTDPMPHSPEMEQALLGAVLLNPQAYFDVAHLVEADDFYVGKNRWVWDAFVEMASKRIPIDIRTVSQQLESMGRMKDAGGYIFVTGLLNATPTSVNVETYAKKVSEYSRRRTVLNAARKLTQIGFDLTKDLDQEIPNIMPELVKSSFRGEGAQPIGNALSALYDEIKLRMEDPKEIYGMATGLLDFDKITSGMQPGEITILSGEPGLGKSILAVQMGMGMAINGYPGAIYEMEMGKVQTVRRTISAISQIESRKMRTGWLNQEELSKVLEAINTVEKYPVYFSDSTSWTTAGIRADLARLKSMVDIRWFVLDYMFLLQDNYGGDDYERLGKISKSLKAICLDLNVSGLVISSLTKTGMGSTDGRGGKKTHSLADLRGSGQIPFDADVVWFIERESETSENIRLKCHKYREESSARHVDLVKVGNLPLFGCPTVDSNESTWYQK